MQRTKLIQVPDVDFLAMVSRFNVFWESDGHDSDFNGVTVKNDITISFKDFLWTDVDNLFEHLADIFDRLVTANGNGEGGVARKFKQFDSIIVFKLSCFLHRMCQERKSYEYLTDRSIQSAQYGFLVNCRKCLTLDNRVEFGMYTARGDWILDIDQKIGKECKLEFIEIRKNGIVVDTQYVHPQITDPIEPERLQEFTGVKVEEDDSGSSGTRPSRIVCARSDGHTSDDLTGQRWMDPYKEGVFVVADMHVDSKRDGEKIKVRVFGVVSYVRMMIDVCKGDDENGAGDEPKKQPKRSRMSELEKLTGVSSKTTNKYSKGKTGNGSAGNGGKAGKGNAGKGNAGNEKADNEKAGNGNDPVPKVYLNPTATHIGIQVSYYMTCENIDPATPILSGMILNYYNDHDERINFWRKSSRDAPAAPTDEELLMASTWPRDCSRYVRVSWLGTHVETFLRAQLGVMNEEEVIYGVLVASSLGDGVTSLCAVDLLSTTLAKESMLKNRLYLPVQNVRALDTFPRQYIAPTECFHFGDLVDFFWTSTMCIGRVCKLSGADATERSKHVALVAIDKADHTDYFFCPQWKLRLHVCLQACQRVGCDRHPAAFVHLSKFTSEQFKHLTVAISTSAGKVELDPDNNRHSIISHEVEFNLTANPEIVKVSKSYYPCPGPFLVGRVIGLSKVADSKHQVVENAEIKSFTRGIHGDTYTAEIRSKKGKNAITVEGLLGPLQQNVMQDVRGNQYDVHLLVGVFAGCQAERTHVKPMMTKTVALYSDTQLLLLDGQTEEKRLVDRKAELFSKATEEGRVVDDDEQYQEVERKLGDVKQERLDNLSQVKGLKTLMDTFYAGCGADAWACVFRCHHRPGVMPQPPSTLEGAIGASSKGSDDPDAALLDACKSPALHDNVLKSMVAWIRKMWPSTKKGSGSSQIPRIQGVVSGRCPSCVRQHVRCVWFCPRYVKCIQDGKCSCGQYWCTMSGRRHLASRDEEKDEDILLNDSRHGQDILQERAWTAVEMLKHQAKYGHQPTFDQVVQKVENAARKLEKKQVRQAKLSKKSEGKRSDDLAMSGDAFMKPASTEGLGGSGSGGGSSNASKRQRSPSPALTNPLSHSSRTFESSTIPNLLLQDTYTGLLPGDWVMIRRTGELYKIASTAFRTHGQAPIHIRLVDGEPRLDIELELLPPLQWFTMATLDQKSVCVDNTDQVSFIMDKYWTRYKQWYQWTLDDDQDQRIFKCDHKKAIDEHNAQSDGPGPDILEPGRDSPGIDYGDRGLAIYDDNDVILGTNGEVRIRYFKYG